MMPEILEWDQEVWPFFFKLLNEQQQAPWFNALATHLARNGDFQEALKYAKMNKEAARKQKNIETETNSIGVGINSTQLEGDFHSTLKWIEELEEIGTRDGKFDVIESALRQKSFTYIYLSMPDEAERANNRLLEQGSSSLTPTAQAMITIRKSMIRSLRDTNEKNPLTEAELNEIKTTTSLFASKRHLRRLYYYLNSVALHADMIVRYLFYPNSCYSSESMRNDLFSTLKDTVNCLIDMKVAIPIAFCPSSLYEGYVSFFNGDLDSARSKWEELVSSKSYRMNFFIARALEALNRNEEAFQLYSKMNLQSDLQRLRIKNGNLKLFNQQQSLLLLSAGILFAIHELK